MPDGTAVRDYVHVCDLSNAHVLALQHLLNDGDTTAINLGTGRGASVRQVVEIVRRITGREVVARDAPRRAGIRQYWWPTRTKLAECWVGRHGAFILPP